jgi:hypothetical protein
MIDRWTFKRKAELIKLIRSWEVSISEVLAQNNITIEEYREWEILYDKHGEQSLKATKLKKYRSGRKR